MTDCHICHGPVGRAFVVREQMFGSGDAFTYGECTVCGCVQLMTPPEDIQRYYPSTYYAHNPVPERTGLRRAIRRLRNRGTFIVHSPLEGIVARVAPYPLPGARDWFKRMGVTRNSRILDVGCGDGMLVRDLDELGFESVTGVDPFIQRDVRFPKGGRLLKRFVEHLEGEFDAIMLHHSLEHMPDQHAAMRAIKSLLAARGSCLVRVPTVTSWAWRHYREDWVQLDAPRHYFLHSVESLTVLGKRWGLEMVSTVYDSTEFQFLGSELYRRGETLQSIGTAFSAAEIRSLQKRANALNSTAEGDQVAVYFRHA